MKDADASKDAAGRYPDILEWWDRMHVMDLCSIDEYEIL